MSWDTPRDDDEVFLLETFEANFERLREQSGRSLAPMVKEAARLQALLYLRRLRALAERVQETEVRLVLPDQQSPAGRRYTLEGVVDIVREDDRTVMYDLKSYLDSDAAREFIEPHYRQLNLYAHIWKGLRGHALDAVGLIATRPTRAITRALKAGDPSRIEAALLQWDPVLEVDLREDIVREVVDDFGATVDQIERREFSPPEVAVLRGASRPNSRNTFAQDVCTNCDARFGCASYRQLVKSLAPGRGDQALREAASDFGGEAERDDWRDAGLDDPARVRFDHEGE